MRRRTVGSAAALLLATAWATSASTENPSFSAEDIRFFENEVRPILAEHCYSCHGPKKQNSGLRLDSRAAVLKGSDYHPVVVPGKPAESELIHAVRHADGIEAMPPKKPKLSDSQISALEKWISLELPWPEESASQAEDPEKHWAWKKPGAVEAPTLSEAGEAWSRNDIDRFIYSRLSSAGLTPSPEAPREVLIRRLSYTLTGLPPTAEEVDAFVADTSGDAYERLVDRLLASPRYGERWARHWLDVARYADTKGYVFQEERKYAYSYTYRDWVIDAFNNDMPFDHFLRCQIAADHLVEQKEATRDDLAAMGFLTLGRRFLNREPDIIDDRIDVVTRGMMGLTVGCARCHHHKYDPVPIEDYYSLYGVFASSTEPREKPLLGEPRPSPAFEAYKKKLGELEAALVKYRRDFMARLSRPAELGAYFLAYSEARSLDQDALLKYTGKHKLNNKVFGRWKAFINADLHDEATSIFLPLVRLEKIAGDNFTDASRAELEKLRSETKGNASVLEALLSKPLDSPGQAARLLAEHVTACRTQEAYAAGDPREPVRALWSNPRAPIGTPDSEVGKLFERSHRDAYGKLGKKIESHKASAEGAPARGMVLVDKANPVNPVVFERGNPARRGKAVPRQFLEVLSGDKERTPFTHGSGRLDLARAVASPDNPLTARVFVNRVWRQHFGQGFVNTPSDFGTRSDPPTHPLLLDFLAAVFMENGWSVKDLQRLILTSATFRQSSGDRADIAERDPENKLIWRMNRQRRDFESMRDSVLLASGKLDLTMHGKAVDLFKQPPTGRRTIYGFIDRQNLPNLHRTFDFASPDQHSPGRFYTTVPQQALYAMNSPFFMDAAEHLAKSTEMMSESSREERIRFLYRRILGRDPDREEIGIALAYLRPSTAAGGNRQTSNQWQYGYGSIDNSPHAVRFTPLAHFAESRWQMAGRFPDHETGFGYLYLDSRGGHPGPEADHGAIRRWTAPEDMTADINGLFQRPDERGDGIRALIVHTSGKTATLLGDWDVQDTKRHRLEAAAIQLKAGDTLDFIALPKASDQFDSFKWTPGINATEPTRKRWAAITQFQGPATSPWTHYIQALLACNEFMFVD